MMVDCLIVGQGIAGTVLSWELQKLGASFVIIDREDPRSSSRVAAGLYNPITGRNMVKTWKADAIFPILEPYYEELDQALGISSLHNTGIYRPFFSNEECNDWQAKWSSDEYSAFIKSVRGISIDHESIIDPLGGIMLRQAGYVDLDKLLTAYKKWLVAKGMYIDGLFTFDELSISEDRVTYREIQAQCLILCEGVNGGSRFFDWLPFTPVKGELMDVESSAEFDFILNRGVFMVPLGNGKCRVGSTYRKNSEMYFESAAETELKEKLSVIYTGEIGVTKRKVGIRPATKDRKPFIGRHPELRNIAIFNGFGSKGVSMAPYFAKEFSKHLILNRPIDKEVDIQRYYSLSS